MPFNIKETIKGWSIIQKIMCGIAVFVTVFVAYWFIGDQHVKSVTPPEGYIYPAAPVLKGVYTLEIYSKSALSKVGDEYISCEQPGLGMYGRSRWGDTRSCCWLEKELNGKKVSVERKYLLTSSGGMFGLSEWKAPYVSKIISILDGKVFYERSDRTLRHEWIVASIRGVFVGAFFYALIIVFPVMVYLLKYLDGDKDV